MADASQVFEILQQLSAELPASPAELSAEQWAALRLQIDQTCRTGQELAESAARYRRLFESNLIGVAIGDSAGNVLDANPAYLALGGWTQAEMESGQVNWIAATPPEYLPLDALAIEEAQVSDACMPYQKEMLRRDGSRLPIQIGFAKLEGTPDRFICFIQDMSAHARVSELETIMDTVPAIIWISRDPQCRHMTSNRFGYEFMRLAPGEDVSLSRPPEEFPGHYAAFKDGLPVNASQMPMQIAASTGEPCRDYEFEVLFEDGSRSALAGNAAPLLDEAGRPYGAVSAFIDITGRKQAEEELKKSEERYRSLFTSMSEGFALNEIVCDEQGEPVDFRFLDVNPAFERITGQPRHQVLGRTLREVIPGVEASWVKTVGSVAQTGTPVHFELVETAPGKSLEVIAFSPERGKVATLLLDVTERRALEEEARQKAARIEVQRRLLEQREQERLQIARDLHDGPLQDLAAASMAIYITAQDACEAAVREQLDEIQANLKKLTGDLRTFMQELRPPTLARCGLAAAIRANLETFHEKHPEIRIMYEPEEGTDVLAEVSRTALYRIYQEMVNNLLKHAHAGQLTVGLRLEAGQVILEVADDGAGFNLPEDWVALARKGHLGLVGARERAEAAGGGLTITTARGKGTRVRAWVPVDLPEGV